MHQRQAWAAYIVKWEDEITSGDVRNIYGMYT